MRTRASQLLACSALFATSAWAELPPEPSRPAFVPFKESLTGFVEQFLGDKAFERWSPSKAVKGEKVGEEVFSYVGKWEIKEPRVHPGLVGDEYLIMTNKAAHHAISAPIDSVIDTSKDDIVVQYEAKFQTGLECGGAYVKLLSEDAKGIHAEEFSDKTPYSIMFGPDKCGSTNKVHLIFRYKNPKTGEVEEKHMKAPPRPKLDRTTVLYTLHVKQSDQSYAIYINNEQVKKGMLLEDFEPAFVPPAEIDDPTDSKPADWVDAAEIADPAATKPADWDEEAPLEIPDEDAVMPAGWLEDEPANIPDPDAEKPEEWDDEEDGDWIPPSVPNPKCAAAPGCGKWVRPMKSNPDYKGKWYAPLIDNPLYKGVWKPRKIPNPEYYEDKTPLANVANIAGIGFELWSMQGEIAFDNIYVGTSKSEADAFRKATFDVKHPVEVESEKASKPITEKEKKTTAEALEALKADPAGFIRTTVIEFMNALKENPMAAIRNEPQSAALVGGLIAVIVGLVGFVASLAGSKPEVQRAAKKAVADTKEKAAEAKDKIAEKTSEAEESVRKRTAKGKDKAQE